MPTKSDTLRYGSASKVKLWQNNKKVLSELEVKWVKCLNNEMTARKP